MTDDRASWSKALRRRRTVPSRRRLVVSIMVALLTVLGIAGIATVLLVRHRLTDRLDRQLATSSENLGALVSVDQLRGISDDATLGASDQATILIGSDGQRLAEIPAGNADGPLPLPDVVNFTADDLRARRGTPFTRGGIRAADVRYRVLVTQFDDDGTLLVASAPLKDVDETVQLLAAILIVSAAGAVTVLGIIIWTVSRAALKPIDDMIDTAGAIGTGDLSARIDTDTTNEEVARLSSALNAMLGQLEEAFDASADSEQRLRRFVDDASHELRTPLTTIQGWADLQQSQGADSPEITDRAMDRITHEAARMTSLVEDLLLLARLDEHRALDTGQVDLTAVATDSVADLRAVEPMRPVTSAIDDDAIIVDGDDDRLRQVVANLLSNVRVHTDPDVAVTIDLSVTDDNALLTIADEGPGLEPHDALRAFDRFYRPEDSRSRATGGSGLGLAIVRSVIEAHGGTVELTSAPGAGASFVIRLPLSARPSAPVAGHR